MSSPSFAELGVSRPVAEVLAKRGILEPFAIQRLVIGDVLAGRDVLAKSPTGSGKTLAFAIPMIERIEPGRGPAALVLAPTRELAAQIVEQSQPLARARRLEVAAVYGGVGFEKQIRACKRADILVATPGRLEDLMARRAVRFDNLQFLVLDEADRMLDMGFRPAVDRIVRACPAQRQTLFFSATLDGEAGRIAAEYTDDAVRHEHAPPPVDAPQVEHRFVPVVHEEKLTALVAELRAERGLTLVFVRTKRGADRLVKRLGREGVDAVAMHGDKSQSQREKALARFESGRVDTLVATDVAARGIHVTGISHVINFDPPEDREGYVHRVGRTARAGETGVGITFVDADQAGDVSKIAAALNLHEEYAHTGFSRPAERPERSARPHASGGPKRRRYSSGRSRNNRW
ncbi:MAG: DEAD/DEAH box helicase [Solirubrobacteraceae bacterium]